MNASELTVLLSAMLGEHPHLRVRAVTATGARIVVETDDDRLLLVEVTDLGTSAISEPGR